MVVLLIVTENEPVALVGATLKMSFPAVPLRVVPGGGGGGAGLETATIMAVERLVTFGESGLYSAVML